MAKGKNSSYAPVVEGFVGLRLIYQGESETGCIMRRDIALEVR